MYVPEPLTRVLPALALCALAAPEVAAGSWPGPPQDAPEADTAEALLLGSLERPFDAPALRTELAALGEPAIADILRILGQGTIQVDGEERALDRKHLMVVEGVLARWPEASLRRSLRALASEPLDPATRAVAIGILARAGSAADLRLLVQVASGAEPGPVLAGEVRRAFGAAVGTIADRESEAASALGRLLREMHPSLVAATVQTMAGSGDVQARDWLASGLGTVPAADPLVLTELRRLTLDARGAGLIGAAGRARLREQLAPTGEPLSIVLAADIVAGIRDLEAIPHLITLLEHREDGVRHSALTALKSLTGQVFHCEPERWTAWYRTEQAWWEREAEREIAAVRSTDPARAAAAIRSLSARRLNPRRTVEALVAATERSEPQVVYLACGALGQMRSDASLPALVACLEHDDESVRVMAWTALKRLTGRQLPLDPRLWTERVLASRIQ